MKVKVLSAISTKRHADGSAYRRVTGSDAITTVYLHPTTDTTCLRPGNYVTIANLSKCHIQMIHASSI